MASLRIIPLCITVCILFSACGLVSRSGKTYHPVKTSKTTTDFNSIETGVASWYGPNFHGKLTANGEVYDMDGLTAAHRTLPFESEVMVENLDNGKSIQVRINDRGPFAKDRIIDLSKAAATELDMIGPGTARVRLYLVKGDLENSRVTDLKIANYTVQLGSFSDQSIAERKAAEVSGSRIEPMVVNNKRVYRVYVGLFQDLEEANRELLRLETEGHPGFVKQIENN